MKKPRLLGLVPARGGSKGLPGKNIRPLAGLPLIGWTLRAARRSGVLERIVVTTDSPEIAAVAGALGALFLRIVIAICKLVTLILGTPPCPARVLAVARATLATS